MRTAALLALVVTTLACGADPSPTPDASADVMDAADPCLGVSCLPGSVCSRGACILAPADASAPDVVAEAGVDAAPEVGGDAEADVAPRCTPSSLAYCGGGCHDLSSSPTNCGACGNACAPGSRCQSGACAAWPDDPRLPGPYQACAGAGALCRGGTACTRALEVYRSSATGYVCTAGCARPNTCPGYTAETVDCVHTLRSGSAQCVRRCAVIGSEECASVGLGCFGVMSANRGSLTLCVP